MPLPLPKCLLHILLLTAFFQTSGVFAGENPAQDLADRVDQENPEFYLRKIYHLGKEARSIGPRVVGWLQHDNWEVRVLAAETIGKIGYLDGRPQLETCLEAQLDWRLAHAAARSLAKLEAKKSLPALRKASKHHWFPIVQTAAMDSMMILEGRKALQTNSDAYLENPPWVRRDHLSIPADKLDAVGSLQPSHTKKHSFRDFEKTSPKLAEGFLKNRNPSSENALKAYGWIISTPYHEGLLLGSFAGEWGGSLRYAPKSGHPKTLLGENIFGIQKWRDLTLVASGMEHGGSNEGNLHQIQSDGKMMTLSPWFHLPGCPRSLWVDSNDSLIAECVGGTLVFTSPTKFTFHSKPPEGVKSD